MFGPSAPDAAPSFAAPPPAAFPSGHEAALASRASLPPSWIPGSLVPPDADAVAPSAPVGRREDAEAGR